MLVVVVVVLTVESSEEHTTQTRCRKEFAPRHAKERVGIALYSLSDRLQDRSREDACLLDRRRRTHTHTPAYPRMDTYAYLVAYTINIDTKLRLLTSTKTVNPCGVLDRGR